MVLSTISDSILKGTTNLRLMQQVRRLRPDAEIVLASDSIEGAQMLYSEGADFVFVARLHSSVYMAEVLEKGLENGFQGVRETERARLEARHEVIP